ncbi:MAG: heat-inducible transcription repressor HrcA [Candidatus Helarchaeota archaeon]|nr:heat-inducible transcription repressor HrcA [Candidatus Helarchaeota archaeon]
MEELSPREKLILRFTVNSFISTGLPVGSRVLWKNYKLDICPATIRNVMFDLEETGLLEHPYTSAGRVPTDKGFRIYIEDLVQYEKLTEREKRTITEYIESIKNNIDDLLKKTSLVLGKLSKQLGVVLTPNFYGGIFEKVELVDISSNKILVIITLKAGLFKTIIIEIDSYIPKSELEETARVINERLYGLTLGEIKNTIDRRLKDVSEVNEGIIRYFVEYSEHIFEIEWEEDVHLGGTKDIVEQPEFTSSEYLRKIFNLLEDKKTIINIFKKRKNEDKITVTIGKENVDTNIDIFSVVTTVYKIGDVKGTLGIIGPRRMRYSKVIPIVKYTAKMLNKAVNTN